MLLKMYVYIHIHDLLLQRTNHIHFIFNHLSIYYDCFLLSWYLTIWCIAIYNKLIITCFKKDGPRPYRLSCNKHTHRPVRTIISLSVPLGRPPSLALVGISCQGARCKMLILNARSKKKNQVYVDLVTSEIPLYLSRTTFLGLSDCLLEVFTSRPPGTRLHARVDDTGLVIFTPHPPPLPGFSPFLCQQYHHVPGTNEWEGVWEILALY